MVVVVVVVSRNVWSTQDDTEFMQSVFEVVFTNKICGDFFHVTLVFFGLFMVVPRSMKSTQGEAEFMQSVFQVVFTNKVCGDFFHVTPFTENEFGGPKQNICILMLTGKV